MNDSGCEPVFIISVAARLLEMHPQTLRKYEREGLIAPSRTTGNLRLYSDEDLERLRQVKYLVGERDDAVEIVMIPGLLSQEGVDAPATIQPDADPDMLQCGDDAEDTTRIHHLVGNPLIKAVGQTLTWIISISIMSQA